MDLHERFTGQPVLGQQLRDALFCRRPGDQGQCALFDTRVDADAAQRVEVRFDHVPAARERRGNVMRETALPHAATPGNARCDRPARAERAREPGPAPVLGEMHDEVVALRAQLRKKLPFRARLRERSQRLPRPIDAEHLADRRVTGQHRRGIGVHQRVDFGVRRLALQHRKYRRRQQDVALMAQLDHQRATHCF